MKYLLDHEKFAALKAERGASQSEIARATGLSQPSVSYLLQQPSDARVSTVEALMSYFELYDLDDLLSEYEGDPADPPISGAMPYLE